MRAGKSRVSNKRFDKLIVTYTHAVFRVRVAIMSHLQCFAPKSGCLCGLATRPRAVPTFQHVQTCSIRLRCCGISPKDSLARCCSHPGHCCRPSLYHSHRNERHYPTPLFGAIRRKRYIKRRYGGSAESCENLCAYHRSRTLAVARRPPRLRL